MNGRDEKRVENTATRLEVVAAVLEEKVAALPCRDHAARMDHIEEKIDQSRVILNRWMGGLGILGFVVVVFKDAIIKLFGG